MRKVTNRKAQQGFTLIEIIAVLVILGILAAVAIPKYQDLQITAREKGAQGILAGAASSASLEYSSQLLAGGTIDTGSVTAACSSTGVTGEYSVACSGWDPITITVTHTKSGSTYTGTWAIPN